MNSDPRLTAYALGELTGAERAAFERELAASTTLQHAMKETIAVTEALRALPAEDAALADAEREKLLARCAANLQAEQRQRAIRRRAAVAGIAALAACIVVATIFSLPRRDGPPATPPTALSIAKSAAAGAKPQLLAEAESHFQNGRYDLAEKRARQGLQADGANQPARETLEKIDAVRAESTKNQTRSHLQLQASTAAASPVFRPAEPTLAVAQTTEAAGAPADFEDKNRSKFAGGFAVGGAAPQLAERSKLIPASAAPFDDLSSETYADVAGNVFQTATAAPLSTFSIDVDTASYANVRRFLGNGQRPPAGAVRLEELINYFPYALPPPAGDAPFSVTTEVGRAPWNERHLLARVALKGRDIAADKLPPSNLVFLVDVSGSMQPENKLPLLKRSLRELVQRLSPRDRVAIVVYAGSSGLALPPTSGEDQPRILDAIDRLESGGSTNGASGIRLAYETARENFLEDGNNRVILCTDGDFNVGVTSKEELTRLIERERKSGVFLSVLGFGTGNLKDATMENLANRGNGNYAYIDSPAEGRKVLVEQMGATLFTIAKDVKIQVEFNPATVAGYRLIGYENRLLAKEDFNDDTKDAGEIGAGHTVTALYEIVPAGQALPNDRTVDALKYQEAAPATAPAADNPKFKIQNPKSPDLFTVKLRFKAPDGDTSKLVEKVVGPGVAAFDQTSDDFRFASAVAAFGMKLRADPNDATMAWSAIRKIARASLGEDAGAYRAEFLTLIEKARQLDSPRGE